MYSLRPFEKIDADYEIIVDIRNKYRPDEAMTLEQAKFHDEHRPKKFVFQADFVLHSGKIIGIGDYRQTETLHRANKFRVNLICYPDHDDLHGALAFYHKYALSQMADKNLDAIVADTREDRPKVIEFLEQNGFIRTMRYPISQIDLDTFDPTTFDDKVNACIDSGIEIINVVQLKQDHPDDWNKLYYDLENAILKDVPMPDEHVPDPLDLFTKSVFEHPSFMPEAHFLARENGQYVGLSCVWKHMTDDTRLFTGLTGVLRSHRRRGVATALKVSALSFAKERGVKFVKTDNEENNPMYDLNMQLGFTPLPAYVDFEKPLK